MMSLAYSSVYGNKIRKLWKLLAKNDLLTSNSYEFARENKCKVRDCDFQVDGDKSMSRILFSVNILQAKSAMEIFRHIRENHLTEIKQLKIRIGKPPRQEKMLSYKKPGPKSKTIFRPLTSSLHSSASQSTSDRRREEEMDFESAISSLAEFAQEQEMIITHKGASVTLKADL